MTDAYSSYMAESMQDDGGDGYLRASTAGAESLAGDFGMDDELTQEDCWDIIRSFFEEKTLVAQQLDSFNDFLGATMQELVYEVGPLTLEQVKQYTGDPDDRTVSPTPSPVIAALRRG